MVEFVEGFLLATYFQVYVVEQADYAEGIVGLKVGLAAEQVADGDEGWGPDRFSCSFIKVFAKEEPGPVVGENDGHFGEFVAEAGVQVFGGKLEKGGMMFHGFYASAKIRIGTQKKN